MKEKDLDMAYLAGVMDGDGSFSIGKLKNLYFPILQCSTWRTDFLELLKEKFGGNLVKKRMHICKDGSEGHALTLWRLRSNENCRPALEKLIPFLKIKKERAQFLLNFINDFKFIRGKALSTETIVKRESLYVRMLAFNDWRSSHENISKSVSKNNTDNQEFWAYVAGLMDTDGSFSIKKQVSNKGTHVINARYIPVISIGMCDTRAINYIRDNCCFGNLCVPKNKATNKGVHYHFQIHSKVDGADFAKRILPFLRSKKQNAEVFIKFCEESENTKYCKGGISQEELAFRDECYESLKKLNKYGVYKPTLIDLEA